MSHAHLPLASIRPAQSLFGSVGVPGDKSISHHVLLLAGLAVGESRIAGLLEGEGTLRMVAAMRALGAEVVQDGPGVWRVAGRGVGGLREPGDVLDMGGSGIAVRLLCGILAGHDLFAIVTGGVSLRRRSMRQATELLKRCGAQFRGPADGRLPLAIQGARDALPIEHRLTIASAPMKSALLLAGLNAPGWTRVEEPEATCDHVERMLRHFGAQVLVEPAGTGRVTRLIGQPELQAADVLVPGDVSLAAFPLVAALIVPGSVVTVQNVGLNPQRIGLFATLRAMGARLDVTCERLEAGEPVGDVTATYTGLCGAEVPAERVLGMIDDYPILAVAAACARGSTRICGHAELRAKTGSRLSSIAAMLKLNGVRTETDGDDLVVRGNGALPTGGGRIETRMDHSLAMSALILGLATASPVGVSDSAAIDSGFPGFVTLMRKLGAAIA